MTNETKMLAICTIAPVLADFIEDLNDEKAVRFEMKRLMNNVHNHIRKLDEFVLKGTTLEEHDEVAGIQRAFRQLLENLEQGKTND